MFKARNSTIMSLQTSYTGGAKLVRVVTDAKTPEEREADRQRFADKYHVSKARIRLI